MTNSLCNPELDKTYVYGNEYELRIKLFSDKQQL